MKGNGKVKKVLSHLKEDEKEYRGMIKDDKKLKKALKAKPRRLKRLKEK